MRARRRVGDARCRLFAAFADELRNVPRCRADAFTASRYELLADLAVIGFVRGILYEDECHEFHGGTLDPKHKHADFLRLYAQIEAVWASSRPQNGA